MAKRLNVEKEEFLWEDRKRYFGLPLSFTQYQASKERIYLRHGLLKTVTDEAMIYRIMDIKLVRTLWQKLFGMGTITLISSDKTTPLLILKNIARPDEVRRFLSNLIDKQRIERGITSSEFLGGIRPGPGHHGDVSHGGHGDHSGHGGHD
ncbi:MAG: PH domain-containing protein [Oscillospiraceae bacterium]|nr:PH domain-containing protein [Oscillospiraceae bacterium]